MRYCAEIVADKKNGTPRLRHITHFAETLFLKLNVADGEDFVDEKDFGFEVGSNGERGSALALFLIRSELRLVGTQAYSGFDAHWGWPGRGDALKDAADEDQYRAAGRQRL